MSTAEPRRTGAYDDGGVARCRETGQLCLGHRKAAEMVADAKARGQAGEARHCPACSAWHYFSHGRRQGRPPATGPAARPRPA